MIAMKRIKSILIIIFLLIGQKSLEVHAIPDDNHDVEHSQHAWPMFRGNAKHTGQSDYNISHNHGGLKWIFKPDDTSIDSESSSFAIDSNGTIYISRMYPNGICALNPNGSLKWLFDVGENKIRHSSPAIDRNGTIYICAGYRLYAIQPNGLLKWYFTTNGSARTSPVLDRNEIIYIGSLDNNLYAVFPNGTLYWSIKTNGRIESTPAIDINGTIYFIGRTNEYSLFAVYPNGTLKWTYSIGDTSRGTPSIGDDGIIYFYDIQDYLYAVYPNGTLKWKFNIPHGPHGDSTYYLNLQAAIDNDGIIYSGSINALYAIYPDGTLKWKIPYNNDVFSPIISNDKLLLVGVDSELWVVDSNGNKQWNFKAKSSIHIEPVIGNDGTIYIVDNYRVYALFGEKDRNKFDQDIVIISLLLIFGLIGIIIIIKYYKIHTNMR